MVNAMGIESAQDFFAALEKSNVLDADKIEAVKHSASETPDAQTLARLLLKNGMLTKWQVVQLLNGVSNLTIGKYRLLDVVGERRIGREVLAEHAHLARRVTLQLISRKLTGEPARLKRFLAEARRTMVIDHASLIHTFDVDHEGELFFLVTEHVAGDSLTRRVAEKGPLSLGEAAEYFRQVAEGLREAATQKVYHGELHPDQLTIDRTGQMKLRGLGSAKLVDGAVAIRSPKEYSVTPFLAPEARTLGADARAGLQSDLFGLGQTLFFALTGKAPRDPSGVPEERKKAIMEAAPSLPAEFVYCFARMIAPKSDDRFANWDEVIGMFTKYAVKPTIVRPTPASGPVEPKPAAPAPAKTGAAAAPAPKSPTPKSDAAPPPARKRPAAPAASTPAVSDTKAIPTSDEATTPAIDVTEIPESAAEEAPQAAPMFAINAEPRKMGGKKAPAKPAAPAAKQEPAPAKTAAPAPAAKGKKQPAAKVEAKQETTEKSDSEGKQSEPTPAGKKKSKKLDPRLALGIVAGGGTLMLLIGGLVLYLAFSGGEKKPPQQLAQNADPGTTPEAKQAVNPEEAPNPGDDAPNPGEVKSSKNPEDDAPNPGDIKPAQPSVPMNEPGESSGPPAGEPAKEENPKPEVTPEPAPEEKTPEPEKVEPMPPSKVEPPPKPAPPPAAPKTTNIEFPFKDVPTSVDLPDVKDPPVVLAKVNLGPTQTVLATLYGGDTAGRTKQQFTMETIAGDSLGREWVLKMVAKVGEEAKTIAQLKMEGNELKFAWDPVAETEPASLFLQNCMIEYSSGKDSKKVALRKPVELDPAKFDLEKPGAITKIAFENGPDPKILNLEIVPLDAKLYPNAEMKPAEPLVLAKGSTTVWFGPAADKRILGLKFDVSSSLKGAELKTTPYHKSPLPGAPPPAILKPKMMAQEEMKWRVTAENMSKAKPDEERRIKAQTPMKERQDQLLKQMDDNIKTAEDFAKAYKLMLDTYERLKTDSEAVVHFRIVYETGVGKVVLAQTKGIPVPQEKGAKKK